MAGVVAIHDLTKRYGQFTAVDSLSLTIPAGGIFALLGPNGAGKTTVIKLIMGTLKATVGGVRVCGLDAFADSISVKSRVGFLPDEPVFFDYMRGREILRFAGQLHGLDRTAIRTRIEYWAARLQLSDALDEFAENYSRGMKKKLGLICALLHEPDLLILDEPTNGLDPHGTQVLHAIMRETAAAGRSVLFSTHLLDQAERLSDRVAVMRGGRLAAVGTLDELRTRFGAVANLEQLFLLLTDSGPNGSPVEPIAA
jgi:ABC-type multidrug transport system ATPase subunit